MFCLTLSSSNGKKNSWRHRWNLWSLVWHISKTHFTVSSTNWKTSLNDWHGKGDCLISSKVVSKYVYQSTHQNKMNFLPIWINEVMSCRPSVLDNFALLSGQLNTINKLLRNEKTPSFRNQVIIPLLLSPDRDEELAVSIFQSKEEDDFTLCFYLHAKLIPAPLCLLVRNWLSSVCLCSAMRSCRTTCAPSLILRWRNRRSSWVPRLPE